MAKEYTFSWHTLNDNHLILHALEKFKNNNWYPIILGLWTCVDMQDQHYPDSKVHWDNMGPIRVLSAPCWPHEPCYQGSSGYVVSHAWRRWHIWDDRRTMRYRIRFVLVLSDVYRMWFASISDMKILPIYSGLIGLTISPANWDNSNDSQVLRQPTTISLPNVRQIVDFILVKLVQVKR